MPIIPWKPFGNIDDFFNDDWMTPLTLGIGREPAMDIYETDKNIVAEINLPDIDPEKIHVSVENEILKIHGDIEEKQEEKNKGYWKKEIRRGSFERMIKLPAPVKEKEIDAVYEKGLLKITMPKLSPTLTEKKKIKIKIKKD